MRPEDLLRPSAQGLYCPIGDFHVDPTRAVPRAIITHAHSDHARAGHHHVLATAETLDLMALRLGPNFAGARQPLRYGERLEVNGVSVSLHPAGHVLGSAQVRLEKDGLVVVVSGDYKDVVDPTCAPLEPQRCHVFVSEATFALPVFRHSDADGEVAKLLSSVALFPERTHLVGAYSLGKAQRLMALLRAQGYAAPLHLHAALLPTTEYYASRGVDFGPLNPVENATGKELAGAIVIAPPMAMTDIWARRFPDPMTCFASGWMRVRARARQRGVELPLVISDHADWDGLCASILATGCEQLWVTHGAEDALVRWAALRQLDARPLRLVGYGDTAQTADI